VLIVDSKQVPVDKDTRLKVLFPAEAIPGGRLTFGTVTIPPKGRIPTTGMGVHPEDEYSLVVKGSVITGTADRVSLLTAGQAALIPAGEAHWSCNEGEDECEIVWALVSRERLAL